MSIGVGATAVYSQIEIDNTKRDKSRLAQIEQLKSSILKDQALIEMRNKFEQQAKGRLKRASDSLRKLEDQSHSPKKAIR
jgi:hypothetical protein